MFNHMFFIYIKYQFKQDSESTCAYYQSTSVLKISNLRGCSSGCHDVAQDALFVSGQQKGNAIGVSPIEEEGRKIREFSRYKA